MLYEGQFYPINKTENMATPGNFPFGPVVSHSAVAIGTNGILQIPIMFGFSPVKGYDVIIELPLFFAISPNFSLPHCQMDSKLIIPIPLNHSIP